MSLEGAPEFTAAILNIPAEQRSWKVLLKEGKLRPSRLWKWSTLNRPRTPYPLLKDFVSYVWIRRSLELLGCHMKFLLPISDVERRFAVTSMEDASVSLPSRAEKAKLMKAEMARRRAATAGGKVEETTMVDAEAVKETELVSSPDQEPLNKRQRKNSSLVKRKDVESSSKEPIVMPAMESPGKLPPPGLSSFKEPAEFLARARELLLAEDDSFLKGKKTEDVFDTGILGAFQV